MPTHRRASRRLFGPVALALLSACSLAASAQTTQQAIEARLKGHPLYLRGQWAPNNLQFDLSGTTTSPAISAPFTLCGMDVKKINLAGNSLQIDGDRVGLEFDKDTPKRVSLQTKVHITIAGSSGADYGPALDKIFTDGLADLVPSMPFYWQQYAQAHLLPTSVKPASTSPKPPLPAHFPKLVKSVEPDFPDAVKNLRYEGVSMVGMIIEKDGSIHQLHIVRPTGLGLDEEALRAVAQYQFKPATEADGSPVVAELQVEINFQIGD